MKNKTANIAGLSLFLCVCILSLAGRVVADLDDLSMIIGLAVVQIVAFLLPTVLTRLGIPAERRPSMRMTLKIRSMQVFYFSICASIAVSIAIMYFNFLLSNSGLATQWNILTDIPGMEQDNPLWPVFLLVTLLLPTVLEEIFLRGAIFSTHEMFAGTGFCIFLSGLCFALLHQSLQNFWGPFIAGCLYAYLTYAFDCIWPAVLAHLVNNLYYIFIVWVTDIYSAFGIWKVFNALNLIAFLLFTYLSMCSLEKLLEGDKVRRLYAGDGIGNGMKRIVLNIGFFVFILAVIAKVFNLTARFFTI